MLTTMTLTHADDYLAQGETDERMELIEGEIVRMNSPRTRHQAIVTELVFQLVAWCRAAPGRGIATVTIDHRLDDRNVFAPDVVWMSEDRWPGSDVAHVVGPPDLAIEVRSESTWRYDVGAKMRVYERSGLPELWLVDTASRSVLVYRRSSPASPEFDVALEIGEGAAITSPLLPGFELGVREVFAR